MKNGNEESILQTTFVSCSFTFLNTKDVSAVDFHGFKKCKSKSICSFEILLIVFFPSPVISLFQDMLWPIAPGCPEIVCSVSVSNIYHGDQLFHFL